MCEFLRFFVRKKIILTLTGVHTLPNLYDEDGYMGTLKYDKENTVRVCLKLNIRTDKDIISKLERVKNKQGYIKKLIRLDLREERRLKNCGYDDLFTD